MPAVEIANQADAARGGRPDGERDARRAVQFAWMRAEHVVEPPVRAFADEILVLLPECRQKAIRIALDPGMAPVRNFQIVWEHGVAALDRRGEEAGIMNLRQRRL